ncbi:MAG: anti-sigma F factor [Thermacetogeniaceae bacterium]|jgi:stage II sporulation protein AB (anti-sigma F factor)|nr:anti-sigma F factor [Thermoanaerobacterales bacterium]NLN20924.1 anti-sigma F factor [Syntrophomonadaceae bacterium]HAF17764.1 anti-sigma F factor [Peptococcaceae bacterium]
MKAINHIKLEFPSIAGNVRLARIAVAAFASELDYDVSVLEEIKVAVSEAVTNAIVHGYQKDPQGIVTLTASLYDSSLEIVVEDRGRGINKLDQALEPGEGTDPERMGLGFVFMRTFMDELEVTSEPDQGTKVIMRKKLPGEVKAQWFNEN